MRLVFKWIDSPVGLLRLVASNAGLAAVLWENDNPRRVRLVDQVKDNGHATLVEVERQLAEYFDEIARPSKYPALLRRYAAPKESLVSVFGHSI
jgi:hypothetical protein